MKKILSILLFILLAFTFLSLTAQAAETGTTYDDGILAYLEAAEDFMANNPAASSSYVTDDTGTLTGEQIEALNEKAAAFAEKRGYGIYIWIVDLVPEEYAKSIDDLEVYVEDFYKRNNLGYGSEKNGMVLLLEIGDVPGERDYLFYTNGPCTDVFNNSTRERMLDDKVVPLFREAFNNGSFSLVADAFMDAVESEVVSGFVVILIFKLIAVIGVPLVTAWLVCANWKRKMKTAVTAHTADSYIPAHGFNLTGQTDQFLFRRTTRVKIERDTSSGGGSSSSSSGQSSGGKV